MKDPDNIFSDDQIAQLRQARTQIRRELRLDEYDHQQDEVNLKKILKNISGEETPKNAAVKKSTSKARPLSSVLSLPYLLTSFAAGALSVLLYGYFNQVELRAPQPSEVIFRGNQNDQSNSGRAEDEMGQATLNRSQATDIVIPGDSLRLPGSTPMWIQVLQLALESDGTVSVSRSNSELKIRINLEKAKEQSSLGLRVALGLKPDVYGTIAVVFSNP